MRRLGGLHPLVFALLMIIGALTFAAAGLELWINWSLQHSGL